MLPAAGGDAEAGGPAGKWRSLGAPRSELTLDFTLPTGQSFRWRRSGEGEYTGVVGQRLVRLRQEADDVAWRVVARGPDACASKDAVALQDYFTLHASLAQLAQGWAAADSRFRLVHPYFPGARMLRQDPLECLLQFICSSNNHISRIHGMVERLCSAYGTPLEQQPEPPGAQAGERFHAFPTLQQLAQATEEDLRAAGFGYRAKYIRGTVAALLEKPEGGAQWLASLRQAPYAEAAAALVTLPGVGPKVAACICLFSLDKHEAIPVDTHVWQLAVKHYTPSLKGKTLNPKLMVAVERAFIDVFGPYAGWAHNVLFISDLASQQHRLPPELRPKSAGRAAAKRSPASPAPSAGAEGVAGEGKRRRRPSGKAALASEAEAVLLPEGACQQAEALLVVETEEAVATGLGAPPTPAQPGKRRKRQPAGA